MKILASIFVLALVLLGIKTTVHSGDRYNLSIPRSYTLWPIPNRDDPWITSLVRNLARRADREDLPYSVWRLTNIFCSYEGASSCSVFSRDSEDNRFLVWSPACVAHHQGRPWIVSWDHGAVYETDRNATSFYLSPSGRYIVAIGSGPTFTRGRLAPRSFVMSNGSTRSASFKVGDSGWQYTLKKDSDGLRSASWCRLSPATVKQDMSAFPYWSLCRQFTHAQTLRTPPLQRPDFSAPR
jgi:hypothetical protein